jgi:hypothetical protein
VASGAVFELFNSNNDFTTLMPVSSITGSGTFRLSGNSTINQVDNGSVGTRLTLAMQAGGVIDLQDTSRLTNGGWQVLDWTGNMASMNIAGGATLDIWDGTPIKIDALTGTGTVDKVHGGNSPSSLILGVANGDGTFGGTIQNTGGQVALTKQGSGTPDPFRKQHLWRHYQRRGAGTLLIDGVHSAGGLITRFLRGDAGWKRHGRGCGNCRWRHPCPRQQRRASHR